MILLNNFLINLTLNPYYLEYIIDNKILIKLNFFSNFLIKNLIN